MPIGTYGLQSDEQIAQSRNIQGQATMQGAQALGQSISQAPMQAMHAQRMVQQMQDEHLQAQAQLQLGELQKQELAQKMQFTQQLQMIQGQDLALRQQHLQLSKDEFAWQKQSQGQQEANYAQRTQMEFGQHMYPGPDGKMYGWMPDVSGQMKLGPLTDQQVQIIQAEHGGVTAASKALSEQRQSANELAQRLETLLKSDPVAMQLAISPGKTEKDFPKEQVDAYHQKQDRLDKATRRLEELMYGTGGKSGGEGAPKYSQQANHAIQVLGLEGMRTMESQGVDTSNSQAMQLVGDAVDDRMMNLKASGMPDDQAEAQAHRELLIDLRDPASPISKALAQYRKTSAPPVMQQVVPKTLDQIETEVKKSPNYGKR